MHAIRSWFAITLPLASLAACRPARVTTDPEGRTAGAATTEAYPAPPGAGTLTLPHRPSGCGYEVRSVSPGHPRISPHANVFGPRSRVRALHVTFVGDPATSAVIQWSTDAATLASEVTYGLDGGSIDTVADGYSFSYGGGGARREHEVHLCGLQPGRRYRYHVGAGPMASPTYAFTTAPVDATPVRLLVVGDARSDPTTWGVVARHAFAERPDAMLFTGDAVNDGANQGAWDAFFDAAPELLASTPGLWADGNHEGISEVYFAMFAFPDNGQPHRHEHWYATSYGLLHVLVLNDTTIPPSEQASVETDWLRASLRAVDRTRTPWVVAIHHKPMYTDSIGHLPDAVTRGAWLPLWDEYHLNIDFAGHVHNYESSLPIRAGEITDDQHGTRFITFGGAGAPLYQFHARQPWVHNRESTHGYGMLTVTPASMRWGAHREDGSLIETIDIPR